MTILLLSYYLYLRSRSFVHVSEVKLCSCLQIAKAFGASEVIAVDVLDEKLQNARTLGATHTVNAAKEDAVERIKVCVKCQKLALRIYFIIISAVVAYLGFSVFLFPQASCFQMCILDFSAID